MQPESSDAFAISDSSVKQNHLNGDPMLASAPGTQGLDVTGASISSATGEDGEIKNYL